MSKPVGILGPVVELQKKGKGSLLWSKERGKGSFPFLAELATGGGGGCKSKFSKPQMPFFPFMRNSRPGGGGCKSKFSKPQMPIFTPTSAEFAEFSPECSHFKASFQHGKGVLSLWERGPFTLGKGSFLGAPRRLFFSHRKGVPGHGKGVPGPSMTYVIRALCVFNIIILETSIIMHASY